MGSGLSVGLFGFRQASMVFSRKVRKSMLEWLSEGWRPHLKLFYALRINKRHFLSLKNLDLYTDPGWIWIQK
jgi:hypothetical protein